MFILLLFIYTRDDVHIAVSCVPKAACALKGNAQQHEISLMSFRLVSAHLLAQIMKAFGAAR